MASLSSSILGVLLVFCVAATHAVDWDVITPLDDYVHRFDPHYNWVEIEQIDGPGYTLHVLNLTSQKWKDETVSRESVWWHYLNIFVPTAPLIHDAAYFVIGGGNSDDDNPNIDDDVTERGMMKRTADFCRTVGVVAGYLRSVPFQPIHFVTELGPSIPRVEDMIIGHTWKLFIEDPSDNPDPDIVVLLPMTKAAKQGLDALQEFMIQKHPEYNIVKFMPTGFSKRGWVTWLLGCVDRRVFAMAPTVLDLLNMQKNLEGHYRSLGGWSWAFVPYWTEDVSKYLYHPRTQLIETFIDPFAFNERLTMPKLLIAAAGDQFFPIDGTHYFWNELTEPKLFQMWENDDHGLGDHLDQRDHNLRAFFLSTYRGEKLPEIIWTRSEDETTGTIVVQTNPSVISIAAWSANTTIETCEENRNWTCRRDFRKQALRGPTGIMWYRSDVTQIGIDQYSVTFNKRDDFGYRGFFIEMTFAGPANYQMRITTDVNVIPNTFPYPKCETEEECRGRLV